MAWSFSTSGLQGNLQRLSVCKIPKWEEQKINSMHYVVSSNLQSSMDFAALHAVPFLLATPLPASDYYADSAGLLVALFAALVFVSLSE